MIKGCSPFRHSVGDVWLPLMLTSMTAFNTISASCGGFLTLTKSSGSIESPNYPDHYHNHAHCVWLLEAPSGKAIAMTLPAVSGERDVLGGHCNDYVEIRIGNATSTLLFRECVSSTPVSLQSPSRWLWVRFKSNHAKTSTGFRASWTLKSTSDSTSGVSPVHDCQPVRFRCANKECISWAYHCDHANDCGCEGPGSDEHGCGGFNWTEGTRLIVGGFIGAGFFLFVFFGVGFLEIFLKRRSENEYKKQLDDAKRRARLQRNKPATGDAKVVPTFEGVKLEVPPSRTPSPTGSGSIPVTAAPIALKTT